MNLDLKITLSRVLEKPLTKEYQGSSMNPKNNMN